MSTDELSAWAASRHFPQLALSSHEVLRAGELSWQRFMRRATPEQVGQAIARVEQWIAYEQRQEVKV